MIKKIEMFGLWFEYIAQ